MMAELEKQKEQTEVGSVFISNYPPFSAWNTDHLASVHDKLNTAYDPMVPLGLYIHIPFCRKRCKFCYFKVYTDKNSKEIQFYLEAIKVEVAKLSEMPYLKGRKPKFVYIGGGTPSYISARHLKDLIATIKSYVSFDDVEEFTFEAEPGTLTEAKLQAIREVGVTRLSLGVENFDDTLLEENGRAHVSTEIYRVLPWIRDQNFAQFNIDLISGMVGETTENWHANIEKAIEMDPDSITIYQMELPFNTVYSNAILQGDKPAEFADWKAKRAWHDHAINRLGEAGYDISSGYTMVKRGRNVKFRYRDSLWHGADLLPLGCSSFGHLDGIHYQNQPGLGGYLDQISRGELPIRRALAITDHQRLVREMILQLKLGYIGSAYFQEKFGVDILSDFKDAFERHQSDGMLQIEAEGIRLTRKGLLRVDSLLPAFYETEFQNARYT